MIAFPFFGTLGSLDVARALDFGPSSVPLSVGGIALDVPLTGSLDVRSDKDAVHVTVSAVGDLHALQDHALELARALHLPKDNCAHKGANAVVESIDAASLTPLHATVVIEVTGKVTVWACTRVFGATVKVKVSAETVTISIPVELFLPNPKEARLRLAAPATLKMAGGVTAEAARILLGDLNERLSTEVAKLLDSTRARVQLPALKGVDASLDKAAFASVGQSLTVQIQGEAAVTPPVVDTLVALIHR